MIRVEHRKALKEARVGIYLGSMSGPGSGAWTWLFALLEPLGKREELEIIVFTSESLAPLLIDISGISIAIVNDASRIRGFVTARARIKNLVQEYNLDVIHFCSLPIPAGLSCRVIYTLHDLRSYYPREIGGGSWRDFHRKIASGRIRQSVDAVISPSQWARHDVSEKLHIPLNKIFVIPQLISSLQPLKAMRDNIDDRTNRYVLALGHLEIRKNLKVLIGATESRFWPRGVELRIVGKDFGERQNLEKLCERNPTKIVSFESEVTEKRKWELIAGATIVAIPSLIEGFGILIVEAISSGVPVLVSDQAALPEVIGVTRTVIPVNDPSKWALAIQEICGSDKLRTELLQQQLEYITRADENQIVLHLANVYLGRDE